MTNRTMSRSTGLPSATICRSSIIAGPCVMESRSHALETAHALAEIGARARRRADLQDLVRQGQPHQPRGARGLGLERRCRSSPRSASRRACR